jgi:hypothetical protein
MSMSSGSVDYPARGASAAPPTNLGDILERVLDKGLVVAGDIRVNLLDIELLTVKLRLVIASLETAREVGIDWWEHDPWLRGREDSDNNELENLQNENRRLRHHVAELEAGSGDGSSGSEDAESSDEDSEPERVASARSKSDTARRTRKGTRDE